MDKIQSDNLKKLRLIITVIISILILGLLIWDYFHDGVPSHHILDQKNLPAISNWWSAILLPILTWILLGKIKSRIENQTKIDSQYKSAITRVLVRFSIGLVFGIILSVSFINNYKPFLDNVLYLLLILSFIAPIFFSEFILGFVLGMTYTFGAILPTAFILIMAAIGFVIYRFIRPLIMKLAKKIGNISTKSPNR
jgi:uncharacterized protein YacL